MSDSLANQYMQQFKAQLGFIEQSNQVPNEIPKNVQYQEPRRVEQPPQQPQYPLPPSGRINHGCGSDVLPCLHSHNFSKSAIAFGGSTLAHGERRGSGVHFGHGSTVDTRHLNGFGSAPHTGGVMGGTKFGLNDGKLEFSRPRVEKKRR